MARYNKENYVSQAKIEELALEVCATADQRLTHDRASKKLKIIEDNLKANLIKAMKDDGLRTIDTGKVFVDVFEHQRPVILDWSALEIFIRAHNAVDMLQKRLTESAVKLRWDDGVQVPGVGLQTTDKVTTKARISND